MKVTVTVDDCEATTPHKPADAPKPAEAPKPSPTPKVEQVSLLIPQEGKAAKVVALPEPVAGFLRQLYD
jgi:hypothetical protein